MLLATGAWVLKSIVIIVIFHFIIPPVVHAITGNRWTKLPVLLIVAVLAGIFMAWLHYLPYLLFLLWLALNKHSLAAMQEPKFEALAREPIQKTLYYVSTYVYVVVACVSAWFFQMEILDAADPSGPATPLWKYLLGGWHIHYMLIVTFIIFFISGINMGLNGSLSGKIEIILGTVCWTALIATFLLAGWKIGLLGLLGFPIAGFGYAISPKRR